MTTLPSAVHAIDDDRFRQDLTLQEGDGGAALGTPARDRLHDVHLFDHTTKHGKPPIVWSIASATIHRRNILKAHDEIRNHGTRLDQVVSERYGAAHESDCGQSIQGAFSPPPMDRELKKVPAWARRRLPGRVRSPVEPISGQASP